MEPSGAPARGTCYGFEIRSSVPLAYVRGGTGPPLFIRERAADEGPGSPLGRLIAEWPASAIMPWAGRLHDRDGGFWLWSDDLGWFGIDPSASTISVPPTSDPVAREERLWGIPAMLCFMARGDLPLHAAAVEIDGGAAVIAAPSKAGKTTLAAAFVRAGVRLLSEDVTCIRPSPGAQVIPGPAMIRLRQDVAAWLDISGATRVGPTDDRVHLALHDATRGDGTPVPIRGIFLLRRSDGDPRIERLDAVRAVPDLWSLSSRIPTPDGRTRCFEGLVDAVRDVPLWNLFRPLALEGPDHAMDMIATTIARATGD